MLILRLVGCCSSTILCNNTAEGSKLNSSSYSHSQFSERLVWIRFLLTSHHRMYPISINHVIKEIGIGFLRCKNLIFPIYPNMRSDLEKFTSQIILINGSYSGFKSSSNHLCFLTSAHLNIDPGPLTLSSYANNSELTENIL